MQRRLFFSTLGEVQFTVHCKPVDSIQLISAIRAKKPLSQENLSHFVDRIVDAMEYVRGYEICTGVSCQEFKAVWRDFNGGFIDKNPYQENRYSETIRAEDCKLIVKPRSWRCGNCAKIYEPLRRLSERASKESVHPNTPNSLLTDS